MQLSPQKFQQRIQKAREARQRAFERRKNRMLNSKEYKIKSALNELRLSNTSGSHINTFREHIGNTSQHEDMKYKVYKYLVRNGHSVITEAITKDGKGRIDVLDLCCHRAIEILYSETKEELAEKGKYYPATFEIVCVDSTKEFSEKSLS